MFCWKKLGQLPILVRACIVLESGESQLILETVFEKSLNS